MLILEIALGIVLGVLILAFLPVILLGLLILLGLGVVFVFLFIIYGKQPDSGLRPPPASTSQSEICVQKDSKGVLTFARCSEELVKKGFSRIQRDKAPTTVDSEVTRLREQVLGKMKESRASGEKLLATHEEEKNKLTIEYERRRRFFKEGLISRSELNQVERALAEAIVRVEEDKRWLAESDIAIKEAFTRDELLRSSKSPQSNDQ